MNEIRSQSHAIDSIQIGSDARLPQFGASNTSLFKNSQMDLLQKDEKLIQNMFSTPNKIYADQHQKIRPFHDNIGLGKKAQ